MPNTYQEVLNKFKNLEISRKELTNIIGANPIILQIDKPVLINSDNVKQLLLSYQEGGISFGQVIEWCDVVRFSELFDYPEDEKEQEKIATIIDEIQDLEDSCDYIPDSDLQQWLLMLQG